MDIHFERPTVVDLFAGCGGGSIGFARRGFLVKAAVENDPDAAASYSKNVGIAPIVCDIRRVTGAELRRVAGLSRGELTVLLGCPPCQSYTVLRRGSAEIEADRKRYGLVSEFARFCRALRPRHVVLENVPGMVDGRGKPEFEALCEALRALHYRLVWTVVEAADFGVPQWRRRLLLIGSRVADPKLPVATHSGSKAAGLDRHATVKDAISGMLVLDSGSKDPSDPLHRARRHREIALRRLRAIPEGGGRADLPVELRLACHANHGGHYDVYGRMAWDKPSPTITSGCTNVTRGRFGHPTQDRALTLREALLLQTFPRDAELVGSDDEMARQVGNAVPVRLAERIADTILEMERQRPARSAP